MTVEPTRILANPFAPAAGARPPLLAGREVELECLSGLAAGVADGTARGLILLGPDGLGKTSLLRVCEDLAEAHGVLTHTTPLQRFEELGHVVAHIVQTVVARLRPGRRELEHLRRAVSAGHVITANAEGPLLLTADPKRTGQAGKLTRDLEVLLSALGRFLRGRGTGLVIVLDDVHRADDVGFRALATALHRVAGEPLALVAAGLQPLPRLGAAADGPLDAVADVVVLGALDDDAATRALTEPLATSSSAYDAGTIARVVEWAGGVPLALQLVGRHLWNVAAAGERDDVAERAIAAADADARQRLHVRLGEATGEEQRFLRAMAALGPGPFDPEELAELRAPAGERPLRTLGLALARLRAKELLWTNASATTVGFAVPGAAEMLATSPPTPAGALAEHA